MRTDDTVKMRICVHQCTCLFEFQPKGSKHITAEAFSSMQSYSYENIKCMQRYHMHYMGLLCQSGFEDFVRTAAAYHSFYWFYHQHASSYLYWCYQITISKSGGRGYILELHVQLSLGEWKSTQQFVED